MMKQKLKSNLDRINERIQSACAGAARSPDQIKLVVITKYVALDVIRQLVELGVHDLGESRPQELCRRAAATQEWIDRQSNNPASTLTRRDLPRWHQVGHVQRNKVKSILPWVHMVHSVDTLRIAEELNGHAQHAGVHVNALLEVNVANDPDKHGVKVAAATHLSEMLATLDHVRYCGLMVMAPLTEDVDEIQRVFEMGGELFDEIRRENIAGDHFKELSMGMSNDFEHAIKYGATIVRIGSAVFEGIMQPAGADGTDAIVAEG